MSIPVNALNPVCVSGMATMSWTLTDEIAMYRRAGAGLIGLQASKVAATPVPEVAELLAVHDVRLGYLVHPFSAHPDDESAWEEQISALAVAVQNAHALGSDLVYMTSGPSGQLEWEDAAERLADRVAPVVRQARHLGVRLAVENTLPVKCDISFTHSAREAFALADRLGIGVCLDLYCCWQERGLGGLVKDQLARIELLQLSDFVVGTSTFPNRWVPGDADLPLERLLATALNAGYDGVVDVELLGPAIEAEGAESAVTRSVAWMRRQIAAANA